MRPPPGPTRPPAQSRTEDEVLINMFSKAMASDLLAAPGLAGLRHFFANAYATHRRSSEEDFEGLEEHYLDFGHGLFDSKHHEHPPQQSTRVSQPQARSLRP